MSDILGSETNLTNFVILAVVILIVAAALIGYLLKGG